jgi:Predicted Zn-dependent protease (DUF2268)
LFNTLNSQRPILREAIHEQIAIADLLIQGDGMKKHLAVALMVLMSVTATQAQSPKQSIDKVERRLNHDPEAAQVITSDIPNFWRAFDHMTPENDLFVFKREYLDKGSPGLKDFSKARFTVCDLVNAVESNQTLYSSVRQDSLKVETMKARIRTSFRKLKQLYPEAVFPDVYFLIGANNSGGTTADSGLLIGTERYAGKIEDIVYTVAHELVHYQQKYPQKLDLIGLSIKEGSADFIGELISGKSSNADLMAFGDIHERELWAPFLKDNEQGDWGVWLYDANKAKARGLPKDMGYYIGYKITEAYYKKASDKQQAIKDILEIKDMKQFLRDSGYGK